MFWNLYIFEVDLLIYFNSKSFDLFKLVIVRYRLSLKILIRFKVGLVFILF